MQLTVWVRVVYAVCFTVCILNTFLHLMFSFAAFLWSHLICEKDNWRHVIDFDSRSTPDESFFLSCCVTIFLLSLHYACIFNIFFVKPPVADTMVLAANENDYVPTNSNLHDWGARMLPHHFLPGGCRMSLFPAMSIVCAIECKRSYREKLHHYLTDLILLTNFYNEHWNGEAN